ncbi:hypothetical protein [Mesorhizobium sp. LNHC221B00]|uniref:hypothetical protein n=1 Tax=Mesorhizobium sp. LNHC221B00 TaxID=1287233 RepID=UPI00041777E5
MAAAKMIQIKALQGSFFHSGAMWNPIASAPYGRSLELAVIDDDGLHTLVFPCEKGKEGWKDAATGARVGIRPTHWRHWKPEHKQTNSLPA